MFRRILIIIQLCIAFSMILWYLFQPFMGEYYSLRSRILLYDFVMGNRGFIKDDEKLLRNKVRFQQLPEKQSKPILDGYHGLTSYLGRSAWKKIADGIHKVLWELPAFKLAWIFFSIWISILLLKGRKEAAHAVWLLPLITLFYGIDNRMYGIIAVPQADEKLFPTEEMIVMQPLSGDVQQQQQQLQESWNQFLLKEWGDNNVKDINPLETAEFNFTIARLERLQKADKGFVGIIPFNERDPFILLSAYIMWNLLFAWTIYRSQDFI